MTPHYQSDLTTNRNKDSLFGAISRLRVMYSILILIVVLFGLRLFYVQIIRYGYYKNAALSDQLKQYEIAAPRGIIEAHNGSNVMPIVLNQRLFTLYADPVYIKNPDETATKVTSVIGGQADKYAQLMRSPNTRYVVLAKKLNASQSTQLLSLGVPGLGTQEQDYRAYPNGMLAAQLLGFVDDSGSGQYGLEEALNKTLTGKPGQVKAVTDVNGVPLAANKGNTEVPPVSGSTVLTTLDLPIQVQLEQVLKSEYEKTKSKGLSAIVMDPYTGRIKAMANYPTYDPSNYQQVNDPKLFLNSAVTNAIEPGSIMKTLTTATALDLGVIQPNTSFYDPAHWVVDDFNITDIEQDGGAREQNIASILSLSLNTGAVWLLMQMGGGQINQTGITAWHNYLVNHFRLSQNTNIEQGYESAGYVPSVDRSNPAIDLQFANTAFGQGLQVTALQMGAALSSVLNGGTYYQPTLVDQVISPDGTITANKPQILAQHVVQPNVANELMPLMQNVVTSYLNEGFSFMSFPSNYIVGGKTGTAQIANPAGGYYADRYNGTYVGFVGGDRPQDVIVVFNTEPTVPGYAGAYGAQPVFADIAHMLINNSFVTPKTH